MKTNRTNSRQLHLRYFAVYLYLIAEKSTQTKIPADNSELLIAQLELNDILLVFLDSDASADQQFAV